MREDGPGSEPLGDLAREVRRRREERSADDDLAGAFESVGTESIDREALWEELFEEGESGPASVAAVETDDDRDVRVVPSRLCHGCTHFAKPPEMACTHDGTEIIERVDGEQFCVADCPMVEDPRFADGFRP